MTGSICQRQSSGLLLRPAPGKSCRTPSENACERTPAAPLSTLSTSFFRQRPNVVDHFPRFLIREAVAFARHFSFSLYNDVEYLAVAHLRKDSGIVPIVHFQAHGRGEITFAIPAGAVAHGAIETEELLGVRQILRRRLHWILPFSGRCRFRGGGRFFRFLLRFLLERICQTQKWHQQKPSQAWEREFHSISSWEPLGLVCGTCLF